MSVFGDIISTYRNPGAVVRRKLAENIGEEQLLAYVMGASILTFAARIPKLIDSHAGLTEEIPKFTTFIGSNMVASLIFAPLFLYGLAALSHLVAKVFGAKGTWFAARLALFWSLFALQPVVLVQGYLVYPYVSELAGLITSTAIGFLFLVIWFVNLWSAEQASV